MEVWLMRTSEILPIKDGKNRLLRMGMLGEKLSDAGHHVVWFASSFDHFKKKHLADKDEVISINDNYELNLLHTIGYKKNISISRIINHKILAIKLKKKINKLKKPDLIYASFPTIEFAYEAVKYGKKNNVPVIIDVRDLWPDIFNHNLKGIIKFLAIPYIKFLNYQTKKIMRNCYSITSISDLMLDWGIQKGGRIKSENDKSFYIGYKHSDAVITKKVKTVDANKFNICFFATINNQFNYEIIVEIAKKLRKEKIDILICGLGPKLDYFKELAHDCKNIKFLGWQEKEELNYILNNSKIGFAPYKDTFDFQMSVSNKFAEYISYGLPIVITSSGYMKELIDTYELGISSHNVDEICEFIIRLKNDEKLYKTVSKNSSKLYKDKFDADKIYKNMVKYLEKVSKEYKK